MSARHERDIAVRFLGRPRSLAKRAGSRVIAGRPLVSWPGSPWTIAP